MKVSVLIKHLRKYTVKYKLAKQSYLYAMKRDWSFKTKWRYFKWAIEPLFR